jgi:hypothetical protein
MKRQLLVLLLLLLLLPLFGSEATAGKRAVLTGKVTDPDGRPLACVLLSVLTREPSKTSYLPPAAPPTGPDGAFVIPDLPEGRIQLHGSLPGYVQERLTVCRLGEPVHLTMRPLDGPPRGPDGKPVAGPGLFAAFQPGCDEDGKPCPPGSRDEECRPRISGRIVDAAGAPLEEARVTAVAEAFEGSSRTWGDGVFGINGLPDVPVQLTVERAGYKTLRSTIEPFSGEMHVVAVLAPEEPGVTGKVTDPEGKPIAGAEIWKDRILPEPGEEPALATVAGSDGSFEIPALTEDEGLVFCAEGFLKGWIEVVPEGRPLRVTMQPAATIRGWVLGPDGSPLSGVRVFPSRSGEEPHCFPYEEPPPCPTAAFADTDSAGSFELAPLVPGWYTLRADFPGLQNGVRKAIRADAGAVVEGVEIRLPAGVAVTGRVLDPKGAPIPNATVGALSGDGGAWIETAANGSFRVEAAAAGEVTLLLRASGFREERWSVLVPAKGLRADFTMSPGQPPIEIPDPVPDPEGASETEEVLPIHILTGRVLEPDGLPAAGVELELRRGEHENLGWHKTRGDGTFSIEAADGAYLLITRDRRFAEIRLPVHVDGGPVSGIELRLDRGARLHGRFTGLAPGEVPLVHASANKADSFRSGQVDLDGGWSVQGLAPGTWEVEASLGSSRKIRQTVEIPPGVGEMELDLDFPDPPEGVAP